MQCTAWSQACRHTGWEPVASRSNGKVLVKTQQHEKKEVSGCSVIHVTELGFVPGSTACSITGLIRRASDGVSISLVWIWKAISIKSLGPFSDIHMLSSNLQTIYGTPLRCSIVLAPLPIKVPPSYVQRVTAWSFQDPHQLSNCFILRHCEIKSLWMPATVTLLCVHHLIWGGVNSWLLTQKWIKQSPLAILALSNFHVPKGA